MDMLSVGVCDRMSIDTRTVLAEKKKKQFLSSINLEDMPVAHDEPNLFSQHLALCGAETRIQDAEICSFHTDAAEISAHGIFYIWKEKQLG